MILLGWHKMAICQQHDGNRRFCSETGQHELQQPDSTPISTNIIFFTHMCPHWTATDGAHRFKSPKTDIVNAYETHLDRNKYLKLQRLSSTEVYFSLCSIQKQRLINSTSYLSKHWHIVPLSLATAYMEQMINEICTTTVNIHIPKTDHCFYLRKITFSCCKHTRSHCRK